MNEERSSDRLGSLLLVTQPGRSRGGTPTQACEPPDSIREPYGNPEVIMSPRAQGTLRGGQHTCAHRHGHTHMHMRAHSPQLPNPAKDSPGKDLEVLQAQFLTLTWRGLSTSHIPSLGTGVRATAQGPLAVCIAAGRSVLHWSSR